MKISLVQNYKELLPGLVYVLLGVCFLLMCVIILIIHVYNKLREYDLQINDDLFRRKFLELRQEYIEQDFRQSRLDTKEDELYKWQTNLNNRQCEIDYQAANIAIKIHTLIEIYKEDKTKKTELNQLLVLQREFSNSISDNTKL